MLQKEKAMIFTTDFPHVVPIYHISKGCGKKTNLCKTQSSRQKLKAKEVLEDRPRSCK